MLVLLSKTAVMLNDCIARLIARKLSGEATAEELQELADHMQSNPADQYFEELLASYWNSQQANSRQHDSYSDEHFKHILELAGEKPPDAIQIVGIFDDNIRRQKRITWIKRLSIAAAIGSIVFATLKFIPQHNRVASHKQEQENEVVAKKGARSKLVLPDGSQVWLNSETRLIYPGNFNDSLREVELEGEAYFDVVKDIERPFIVHTSGIDIHVVGTAFNVKSYRTEPTIETTLIHGTIEIVKKNQPDAPRLTLLPHQKLVFNKAEDKQLKKNEEIPEVNIIKPNAAISITALPKNIPDTSIIETSWIYNKLLFEGERFSELAKRMERWFNVKIEFKNDKVANYRLHGSFVNETIEEALQALKLSVAFSYKINGEEVEIDKK
jgi:ferric-dicitrate binding protein FerR (iron transport regulator)